MKGAGLFKICNRPSFQFIAYTILYLSPNAITLFNITPILLLWSMSKTKNLEKVSVLQKK